MDEDTSPIEKKEAEIDQIDDSDIDILRAHQRTLKKSLDDSRIRVGELTSSLQDVKGRKSTAEVDRSRLEKRATKTDSSSDKLGFTRFSIKQGCFGNMFLMRLEN